MTTASEVRRKEADDEEQQVLSEIADAAGDGPVNGAFVEDYDDGDSDDDDLTDLFRAHTSPAFRRLTERAAGVSPDREPTTSVPTCEKVPTSDEALAREQPGEYRYVDHVTDAAEALRASLGRSRERQEKILALIGAGEVSHAKRLAMCGRQSVELGCAGINGCGTPNYVPISCDSRLCPDCAAKRQGRAVGRYKGVVEDWEHPTMMRLSLDHRVEPDDLGRAVDALRGAFGRLRRRVIQPSGSHQATEDGERKRWVWKDDGGEPADYYWKTMLQASGERRLAKRLEMKYVKEGRGIPMDELVHAGFYGIDIKEKEDGRLNVHMHILADVPFLPQAALASVWDDLVGAPVVDVRRVEERGEQGAASAAMEVVGYAAKPPEFESVDNEVAYVQTLKGSKLVQPFGSLHGNTPSQDVHLFCEHCEQSPSLDDGVEWSYNGVVDGHFETALVGGPEGDRPPDEM